MPFVRNSSAKGKFGCRSKFTPSSTMGIFLGLLIFGPCLCALENRTPQSGNLANAAGSETPEMSIELPPFVVTDLAEELPWKYGRVAGFEVLSLCDADITKEFLDSQLRGRLFLPEIFQSPRSKDVSIILFCQKSIGRRAAPQQGSYALADSRWGKELWQEFTGRILLSDRSSLIIAANLYGIKNWISVDTELSSRMLWELTPALPEWITESLFGKSGALVIGGYKDRDGIRLPKLVWCNTKETEALLEQPKKIPALLSFADVFATTPPDRHRDPKRYDLWCSQVNLFARWALYGPNPSPRGAEMFWRFVYFSSKGAISENTFKEFFGESYQEACVKMVAYLHTAIVEPTDIHIPNLSLPVREAKAFKLRPATIAEIARIKGNWERMEAVDLRANFPELAQRYDAAAQRSFLFASNRGEQDPAFLDALGLYEYGTEAGKNARLHLEAAAVSHKASALSLLALAKLRLAEHRAQMAPDAKLSGQALDSVLTPLVAAQVQKPAVREVYELIADVLTQSEIQPKRERLSALMEGAALFPRDSKLLLLAANLFQQAGYSEEALALAKRGMKTATNPEMRERFGWFLLKGSLPP